MLMSCQPLRANSLPSIQGGMYNLSILYHKVWTINHVVDVSFLLVLRAKEFVLFRRYSVVASFRDDMCLVLPV